MKFFKKTIFLSLSILMLVAVGNLVYTIKKHNDCLNMEPFGGVTIGCPLSSDLPLINLPEIQLIKVNTLIFALLFLFFAYKFINVKSRDDLLFLFFITKLSKTKKDVDKKLEKSSQELQRELNDLDNEE
tara:strand:+ start:87 stop:473 length:387 start_codon:yes stop_codon:yes gene_type:complete